MSDLKVDGVIASTGTNTNLTLEGKGTGGVKITDYLIQTKGADISSATSLTLGKDGNQFDVTGTTTITSIATQGIGSYVTLHFDGALTFTHHSTDLILPGAASITTAAGDIAVMYEYASADWRCVSYTKASGVAVVVAAGGLTVGGVVATTSGTDISLGSSLSNVARMTISYETQSLASGTPKLQIGDSGGFHTSGYTGIGFRFLATSVEEIDDTAGFLLSNATAGSACSGIAFITLQDSTNFKYSFHTVNSMTAGDDRSFIAGGSVTLDTEMTQIRLSGGTWDLGSANIIIESKA